MQTSVRPFDLITNSSGGNTVNLAVLATSATVAVSPATVGSRSARIYNSGTNTVFINFGPVGTVATVANSMPMLPNSVETFYFHNDWTLVAAIASATGNTIYITMGEGS